MNSKFGMTKEELKTLVFQEAQSISQEVIDSRRILHNYAEVGFDLEKTTTYIIKKLKEYGYEPTKCGQAGIVATVGTKGKTLLLRADMDALPIPEDSGLEFAASNGNSHSCGHDFHPSMLLGAAKLLKKHEEKLNGCVKLMFQPAEEKLMGAKDMIDNGVLDNPKVDASLALHVAVADPDAKSGNLIYTRGNVNSSGDAIRVTIHGKDTHGSKPFNGVDALSISSYINLALQTVIAKEVPNDERSVVLVGTTQGGTTCNTVSGQAVMDISVRARDNERRDFLIKRINEISTGICEVFRATATVEHVFGAPVLHNDGPFTDTMVEYAKDIIDSKKIIRRTEATAAGEDFSYIAKEVPTTFFYLGAGSTEEGYNRQLHMPNVKFNEDIMTTGVALHTYLAMRWLDDNRIE